jgi:membrane fusion protein, multidrug efflux system
MPSFLARNRSALTIATVALLLALWILSGVLTREAPQIERRAEAQPMTVAVTRSAAQIVERLLTLQGEVQADQRVTVRGETAGRIAALPVELGQRVDAGEVIARISMDDREARLRRAEAAVAGRETDYRAAQQLAREGFQAQLRVETALAELEAARAELESVRLDIANTSIRAPIAGVVNHRFAEVGDFVGRADPVAEVLENHPLRAVVQVPQHNVHRVQVGGPAHVSFVDGSEHTGTVRYISARADTTTRTFRVEITVPNEDRALPSGVSVQVRIPVEQVMAQRISPALIGLDERGRLGVKTVDGDDRVAFHAVDVVRADADGVWVTGLPEDARIITIGQGFVNAGEPVRVVDEGAGS